LLDLGEEEGRARGCGCEEKALKRRVKESERSVIEGGKR